MLSAPEIASQVHKRFDRRDLVFAIGSIERLPDKRQIIRAVGKAESRPVEFDVVLGLDWTKAAVPRILTLHAGLVEIRSTGTKSDEFLKALDSIYRTGLCPTSMAQKVDCEAISLQGNPFRLSSGPLKLKLFFGYDDDYSQVYLNIERTRGRVYLKEKYPHYRAPIVRALSASRVTAQLSRA